MIIKDMPEFGTKKEQLRWLVTNKEKLVKLAKEQVKHADCVSFAIPGNRVITSKANGQAKTELQVLAVINTTNLMDSHNDVHLPGLWDKSLQENRYIMHLQEHQLQFDKICADMDDLIASAKFFKWSELGFSYEGSTQALLFDSTIKMERNPFMFSQYAKGYVKNHSVGMRYVRLILCVNDEEWGAEYDCWNKYYPEVANKDRADEFGYFWCVPEAKVIEGSAVPLGSNWATPTLNTKGTPVKTTSQKNSFAPSLTPEAIRKIIHEQFKTLSI